MTERLLSDERHDRFVTLDDCKAFFERGRLVLPALEDLMEETRAYAGRVRGTDTTGCLRVLFGTDGLPEIIELDPDWRSRAGIDGLADALAEACQNGLQSRWEIIGTEAGQRGWADRANTLLDYLSGDGPPPPDLPHLGVKPRAARPEPFLLHPAPATPAERHVGQSGTGDLACDLHQTHTGTAGFGRLTLTLDPLGMLTCEADPDWLSLQGTESIVDALSSALCSARAQLADADAALAAPLEEPTTARATGVHAAGAHSV